MHIGYWWENQNKRPHEPAKVQQFLHHINSNTMEVEVNGTLPFLDVLIMKLGPKTGHKSVPEAYTSSPTTHIT
jgi:hypothetical protein